MGRFLTHSGCGIRFTSTNCALSPRKLLAALDIEFPGGKEGDFLDGDDDFRAPEGGETFV